MRFISLLLVSFSVHGAVIWPNGTRLQTFQNGFLFGNGETLDSSASGFTFDNGAQFNGPFTLEQSATPSNPSAGFNKLYFKSDENLYKLDSSGNELAVGELNIAGQNQSNIAVTEIETPNNQVTQTGASKALLETGNLNLLSNPGFEHSTFDTSWVTTGTTATISAEVSNLISGNKAFKAVSSAQNISLVQDPTLYAAQLAGMQGYVQMSCSNTAASVSLCARGAGITSTTDCVTLDTTGVWRQYEIPVVLSATSNGISLAATSTTGTTICDEAYVGLISGKTPEVAQAQIAGTSFFAAASGATQTRTSTTLGAFSGAAAITGPTVVFSSVGVWQTTDANLLIQTVNNLPPGEYVAEFQIIASISSTANKQLTIFDGTSSCENANGQAAGTGATSYVIRCPFRYTTQSNRSYELYGSSSAGTITVSNETGTAVARNTRFTLYYYPSASKIYSQQCQNNPTACENVFSAKVSAAGVVSDENLNWINGNCSISATSDFACTFNASIFTVTPNCSVLTTGGENRDARMLSNSSTTLNYRTEVGTTQADTAYPVDIICQKQGADFKAQNVITGTFAEMMKVPGVSKPKTIYYYFGGSSATLASPTECTTGTCVEVYDSHGVGAAPTRAATGTYRDLTIAAGTFANSTPVYCDCKGFDLTSDVVRECTPYFATGDNSWSSTASGGYVGNFYVSTESGTASDAYVQVKCEGSAP